MKINEAAAQKHHQNITYGRIISTAFPLLLMGCLNPLQLISGRNRDNLHHKSVSKEYLGDGKLQIFHFI